MNPYFLAACYLSGILTGWTVHSWKSDSDNLLIAKSVTIATQAVEDKRKTDADKLEAQLKTLNANYRKLLSEKDKVITRDIYRNDCFDNDGLQLVNASKSGNAAK